MNTAVIFDLDGVISDTQMLHSETESILLKRFGISISPQELMEKYSGVSDEEMFAEIFKKNNIHENSIQDLIIDKWIIMQKFTKKRISEVPGAIALIRTLHMYNFKLAVASGSPKTFIHTVLNSLHIQQYFDVYVSSEEVPFGKPAPDIFLLALKRLQVTNDEAIVIEDGVSGMVGAKKAGIKCIGLVNNIHKKYPAGKLITSLNLITLDDIRNL